MQVWWGWGNCHSHPVKHWTRIKWRLIVYLHHSRAATHESQSLCIETVKISSMKMELASLWPFPSSNHEYSITLWTLLDHDSLWIPSPFTCMQQGLNVSLDFTSLACQQVSLSFAVVSESTSFSSVLFSPESSVCIPGCKLKHVQLLMY